jgi:hypothetical protein
LSVPVLDVQRSLMSRGPLTDNLSCEAKSSMDVAEAALANLFIVCKCAPLASSPSCADAYIRQSASVREVSSSPCCCSHKYKCAYIVRSAGLISFIGTQHSTETHNDAMMRCMRRTSREHFERVVVEDSLKTLKSNQHSRYNGVQFRHEGLDRVLLNANRLL